MPEVTEAIRTERLALVDDLETLTPEEWATPSLCGAWVVQDVAAHLAWAPTLSVATGLRELARAGFRPNELNATTARRWSRRGRAAILSQLRTNAATGAKPVGVPRTAALVDAVVHGLDIRRPLGRTHVLTEDAFGPAADFCAATRWPASMMVGGNVRARIARLRLVADDVDWSHGDGPEVRGSTEALMLVLTGRPLRPGELTGAGAETLLARL
jgi:uncharacterized protein (TIGR03083 family)